MPPNVALLICILFIMFVFYGERKRNVPVSWALLFPLLWYLAAASRPVGVWFLIWGFTSSVSADPTEGSVVDQWFYSILGLISILVLAKRRCNWGAIIRENTWLLMLFAFMALSILWSHYPIVSLKRFTKSFCAVVMALVVLTEPKPVEAIAALLRRCAYFTIPLSIVLIRYFRNIGVSWDWMGVAESWVGVTTSKNTLGQVAMTGALCFIWERIRRRDSKEGRIIEYLYIIMSLYLLKGSDNAVSMTSLSIFGVGLFFLLTLSYMKERPEKVKWFLVLDCSVIFVLLLTIIWHTLSPFSKDSFMSTIIQAMGRDMTLTGRTEIWSDVFKVVSQVPMLGVGYGAFWIGKIANIPWSENLTWTLGQAHNGYVDSYLQLGWVGVCLLMAVIIFTIPKIVRTFTDDFEYGRFLMTFFLVVLFVNITESTFLRGDHNMWFLFLLAALTVPHQNEQIVGLEREKARIL